MDRDAFMRRALMTTAFFNFGAAALIAFPDSLGQLVRLPTPAPVVYTTLLALFIALFGGVYAWLARQPVIDRPLVAFTAIGKAGAFAVIFGSFLAGVASWQIAVLVIGDLVFATIFLWWLLGTGRSQPTRS